MILKELYVEAEESGLKVIDNVKLPSRLKGLLINNKILLDKDTTNTEKIAILAEEIEHSKTAVGNILDLRKLDCLKQELLARGRTYERLLKYDMIISAAENHVENIYEFSEFVGLPECFVMEAIDYYKQRYGIVKHKEYIIDFVNQLVLVK